MSAFQEWIAAGQRDDPEWFWTDTYVTDMRRCWNAAIEAAAGEAARAGREAPVEAYSAGLIETRIRALSEDPS